MSIHPTNHQSSRVRQYDFSLKINYCYYISYKCQIKVKQLTERICEHTFLAMRASQNNDRRIVRRGDSVGACVIHDYM